MYLKNQLTLRIHFFLTVNPEKGVTCEQNIFFFPQIVILTSERITRHNMNELCKAIKADFIIRLHFWLLQSKKKLTITLELELNSALGNINDTKISTNLYLVLESRGTSILLPCS